MFIPYFHTWIPKQIAIAEGELQYLINHYWYCFSSEINNTINIFVYYVNQIYELPDTFIYYFENNKGLALDIRSGRILSGINSLRHNLITDKIKPRFITEYNLMDCYYYIYHDIRHEFEDTNIDDFDDSYTKSLKYLPNRDITQNDILLASEAIKYFYDNKRFLLSDNKYKYDILKINKEDIAKENNNKYFLQLKEINISCEEIIAILKQYDKNFCSDTIYTIINCVKIVNQSIELMMDFIIDLYRGYNVIVGIDQYPNSLSLIPVTVSNGIDKLQFRRNYKFDSSKEMLPLTITSYNLFDYLALAYRKRSRIFRCIKECKDVNLRSIPDNLAWYDKEHLPYREIMEEDLMIASESIKNFYNIVFENPAQYQY